MSGNQNVRCIIGCVGQKEVIQMDITYWLDVSMARQKQEELIEKKQNTNPNFCNKPWFSYEDFEDLIQKLKHFYDTFDVCISAQQGNGYFNYCQKYGDPSQPMIEVSMFRAGVNCTADGNLLAVMNDRWGGLFCVIPGPLKTQTHP